MTLQELKTVGQTFKVGKKPMMVQIRRGVAGEFKEARQVPAGTIMEVIRVNRKSIRVVFKYRDGNKPPEQARLVFTENEKDYDLEVYEL